MSKHKKERHAISCVSLFLLIFITMIRSIQNYLKRNKFERFAPKAVLFDMDGVLYDSMPNHAKAWVKCMASYGLEMSEKEAFLYEGMRGIETIRKIAGKQWQREIPEEEAAKIYKTKSAIYSRLPKAELIKGVHCLQKNIAQKGWIIGVVTGSGQETLLQRIIKDFEGLVSPEVLVCAKDVQRGKPAPDPYIKGMQKANVEPWQTIVIENAPLGVKAAVAAQCFTIAVNTGPLPDSVLKENGADLVLHSMDTLSELLEKTFQGGGEILYD